MKYKTEEQLRERMKTLGTVCLGLCSTSHGDDVCIGCGRTYQEVVDWNKVGDEGKEKIVQRLISTFVGSEKDATS